MSIKARLARLEARLGTTSGPSLLDLVLAAFKTTGLPDEAPEERRASAAAELARLRAARGNATRQKDLVELILEAAASYDAADKSR